MCFHSKLTKSQEELVKRFDIEVSDYLKKYYKQGIYNGFDHPFTPIIYNDDQIDMGFWGLIPSWAHDLSIRKKTLNARIETIHEKPSFKEAVNNRCLILADGFYEWQWLDPTGKRKQKYKLTLPDEALYAYAGLFQWWVGPDLTEWPTYTIMTTEANPLMAEIHNSQKRMPIILSNPLEWLDGGNLEMANDLLIAEKENIIPTTGSLF